MKKLLWPLLEKPWQSPVMEVRYGLWQGVSALYSASGRQLGEENTRPFLFNHHVPAETLACKYQGSRSGRQINISALRIAMRHFDEALAITGAVRRFHHQRIGLNRPLGGWDLYIIARASIALIAYQQRCTALTPSTTVSDMLASQYQLISGIFMICREMMNNAAPAIVHNAPISAAALYAYADEQGVFISFNGMACAGSTRKIMDFMAFCNKGALPKTSPSAGPSAGPSDIDASGEIEALDLSTIIGAPENWYQYALATIELDCFIEVEQLSRSQLTEPERGARSAQIASIYRSIAHYCASIADAGADWKQTTDFTGDVLARQNCILQLLGRPCIARISAKHLDRRLSA